jgi:hypothetical membrane protein
MRNGGLIVGGAVIFILGLLLRSDLVEALLNVIGFLIMVTGVVLFAVGVYQAVRRRQGGL